MNPRLLRVLLIVGMAAVYGILCRILFAIEPAEGLLAIVSIAFIYTMPVSLGALVCYLGYKLDQPGRFWALAAPPLTMALLLVGSLLFDIEAAICVVVAAPVVLPFAVGPIEEQWEAPHETRRMVNQIEIAATPETIWRHIAEVPAIKREEIPGQWIYWLGFPRPIAATLDRHEVGGKRHATFEGDVSFYEVVTVWEPGEKLAFTIKADPEFIPHTAFDEHIIVGGRFYDVLDGIYEIEPIEGGRCRLHLTSTHRLSTRFNAYAGWWSEWVMNQIQGSILEVIRDRCERGHVAAYPAS